MNNHVSDIDNVLVEEFLQSDGWLQMGTGWSRTQYVIESAILEYSRRKSYEQKAKRVLSPIWPKRWIARFL